MKEAQQIVSEKTSSLEAEAYKNNRLQVNIRFLEPSINFTLFTRIFHVYRKK